MEKGPVRTLFGHSHWAVTCRYNPFHDQLMLSGGTDNGVNLWRIASCSRCVTCMCVYMFPLHVFADHPQICLVLTRFPSPLPPPLSSPLSPLSSLPAPHGWAEKQTRMIPRQEEEGVKATPLPAEPEAAAEAAPEVPVHASPQPLVKKKKTQKKILCPWIPLTRAFDAMTNILTAFMRWRGAKLTPGASVQCRTTAASLSTTSLRQRNTRFCCKQHQQQQRGKWE